MEVHTITTFWKGYLHSAPLNMGNDLHNIFLPLCTSCGCLARSLPSCQVSSSQGMSVICDSAGVQVLWTPGFPGVCPWTLSLIEGGQCSGHMASVSLQVFP